MKTPKFTTPCFIRKNTPILREELEKLGYVNRNTVEEDGDSICTLPSERTPEYMCFEMDDDFLDVLSPSIGMIDCGENVYLFLGIAAIREDSDKNQWFIYDSTDNIFEDCRVREFFVCVEENVKDLLFYDCEYLNATKATVQELIKYFSGNDNQTTSPNPSDL